MNTIIILWKIMKSLHQEGLYILNMFIRAYKKGGAVKEEEDEKE